MSDDKTGSGGTILKNFPVLSELWAARWVVLVSMLVLGSAGATYSLLAKPRYRAQVTLLPVESKGSQGLVSQLGALGGLAGLAGLNLGTGSKVEPMAVLGSREFARSFIEDEKILTVLLADKWDAGAGKWKQQGSAQPDIRDAVEYFDKSVRKLGEDRKSGLVVLSIEWRDGEQAATWANKLAERINVQLRNRAVADASRTIEYLRGELRIADQVTLQQSISHLLESQMQQLMMARGNPEYAFRIVDPASPPKRRFFPQRALLTLGGLLIGALVSSAWVLLVGHRSTRIAARSV